MKNVGRNNSHGERTEGDVQGENVGALPDKGTDRGMPSSGLGTSKGGADTSAEATNRQGGFNADSDPADRCYPAKPPRGRA